MSRIIRWIGITAVVLLAFVLVATLAVYLISESRMGATYEVPPEEGDLNFSGADTARGKHIVEAVSACMDCHGDDLGGKVVDDVPFLLRVVGPNLTMGEGGLAERSDEDVAIAIRHAVGRDGEPLLIMPSHMFFPMSDDDVAAMVSYLREADPVDREIEPGGPGHAVPLLLPLGPGARLLFQFVAERYETA